MNMSGNVILITGGSSGIGLGLSQRLAQLDNKVIIVGKNVDKLGAAQKLCPNSEIIPADVSKAEERVRLLNEVTMKFPNLNVLFNNAGIQRYPKLDAPESWNVTASEIDTNLAAPIHLAMLFASHLSKQKNAAILNTTSGLSHVPLAYAPIYSATKAALHSFTQSLRYQLRNSNIEVIEVSPPKVDTDLGGPGGHTDGVKVAEFSDAVIAELRAGTLEISYGFATQAAQASRAERDAIFKKLNPS